MGDKILVVDDEEPLRNMIAGYLKGLGHEVETSDGFESAIALMRKKEFDVIITDKNMPHPDGSEESGMSLLEYAQKYHPTAQILVMTGYPSIHTAMDSIKLGAFDYLLKPFSLETLKEKIERVLEYKRFTQPEDMIQTYRTLYTDILGLLAKKETMTLADLHDAFGSITGKIDGVFKVQQRWAKSNLAKQKALDKITSLSEQLLDRIDKDEPSYRLVEKIREESQRTG